MTPDVPVSIAAIISQIVAGLSDAANSYFLNALYYEYEGEKRFTAAMYLQRDDVRNPVATGEALEVEVHLSPERPDWHAIRIPYVVIWLVQQSRAGAKNFTGDDLELFSSNAVLNELIPRWREEVARHERPSGREMNA